MVRASRNVSNARRYGRAPTVASLGGQAVDEFRAWVDYTYPGSTAEDVIGNYRRQTARPAQLGAKLDGYPWAQSFGAFLSAILSDEDKAGARSVIAKVMQERPRNAGFAERVPSEGGFLLPERLRSVVLSYMTRGIVRPRAMVVEMDAYRVSLPVLDNVNQSSGAQALGGLQFSFVEDGSPFPATSPSFGQVTLQASKAGAYLKGVPNELLADGSAFTEDFLPRVIALGLQWFEDDLVLSTGTGAGEPEALLNAAGALAVNRANSGQPPVLADIAGMIKALHPASLLAGMTPGITDVAWLLSESVFAALLELYLNSGGTSAPTTIAPSAPSDWLTLGDGQYVGPSMLGLPMLPNDHQPAVGSRGDVMLCDLSRLVLGDLGEMYIEVSSKGSGFGTDTSNIRIRHRFDARFWPSGTYTTAAGSTVAPLVILS